MTIKSQLEKSPLTDADDAFFDYPLKTHFTIREELVITNFFGKVQVDEIAEAFHCASQSIMIKAKHMGLIADSECTAEDIEQYLDYLEQGVQTSVLNEYYGLVSGSVPVSPSGNAHAELETIIKQSETLDLFEVQGDF